MAQEHPDAPGALRVTLLSRLSSRLKPMQSFMTSLCMTCLCADVSGVGRGDDQQGNAVKAVAAAATAGGPAQPGCACPARHGAADPAAKACRPGHCHGSLLHSWQVAHGECQQAFLADNNVRESWLSASSTVPRESKSRAISSSEGPKASLCTEQHAQNAGICPQVQEVGSGVRSMAMNLIASTACLGQSAARGLASSANQVLMLATSMHCSQTSSL